MLVCLQSDVELGLTELFPSGVVLETGGVGQGHMVSALGMETGLVPARKGVRSAPFHLPQGLGPHVEADASVHYCPVPGQAALFQGPSMKSNDPALRGQLATPTGSPHLTTVHRPLPPSRVIEELHRALATKHRQDR